MPDQTIAPSSQPILEPMPMTAEAIKQDIKQYQFYHLGRILKGCPPVYTYRSLAWTLRDRLMSDWMNT
jgi:starch phosphorylase